MNKLNEVTLHYQIKNEDVETIRSSSCAHGVFRKAFEQSGAQLDLKEYFLVVFLNRANKVIGYYKLSEGGISGTVADARLAFVAALKCLSAGIILCHNHPSQNLTPSQADINLTNQFKRAGEVLNIPVLDHLILNRTDYYSFADQGLL